MNYHFKRLLFIFQVILICTSNCYSQDIVELQSKKGNDYYTTISSVNKGIRVVDQGDRQNAFSCKVIEDGIERSLNPDEVIEYGFGNNIIFVSKPIIVGGQIRKVFLRRIYVGKKLTLYSYCGEGEKVFFLEKSGDEIVLISKGSNDGKNYRETLSLISKDCPLVNEIISLTSFRQSSLSQFFKHYDNCSNTAFPHAVFGISADMGILRLIPPTSSLWVFLDNRDLKYCKSMSLGLYLDYPIESGNFSFHPEVSLSSLFGKSNSFYGGDVYKATIKMTYIKIPLLVRYYFQSRKFFLNTGYTQMFNLSYNQVYDKFLTIGGTDQILNYSSTNEIGLKQFIGGTTFGAGTVIKLSGDIILSLELRYSRYFHRWTETSYDGSELGIHAAIQFNL